MFRYALPLAILLTALSVAQKPQTNAPQANPYLREAAITPSGHAIHIAANSPRPVQQILVALRLKYGWVIDYEDPRYISKLDVVERSAAIGTNPLLPAGGAFSTDVPAGDPTTTPPEDTTLQSILDAYGNSGNPGRFALRKNEDGNYAVVGVGARDDNGKIATQEAVFDSAITIPVAERTATDTLTLICKTLSDFTHVDFTLGVTPRRLLDYTTVKVGGTKTQARSLLATTLQSTGHAMYWDLLFDPSSKGYFLEVHAVPQKK